MVKGPLPELATGLKPNGGSDSGPSYGKRVIASEICDEDFFVQAASFLLRRVCELDRPDPEAAEQGTHFGEIVQRQDEFALELPQSFLESREIGFSEVVAIEFPSPVRRVEIEKCRGAVVAGENLMVWQALDLHPLEAFVGRFDQFREAPQVESRRLDNVIVVIRVHDQACEGTLEQVQIPRCPLNVREALGIRGLMEFKQCTAHKREAETAEKFLMMRLADSIEIDDLAVQVIQNLDF